MTLLAAKYFPSAVTATLSMSPSRPQGALDCTLLRDAVSTIIELNWPVTTTRLVPGSWKRPEMIRIDQASLGIISGLFQLAGYHHAAGSGKLEEARDDPERGLVDPASDVEVLVEEQCPALSVGDHDVAIGEREDLAQPEG